MNMPRLLLPNSAIAACVLLSLGAASAQTSDPNEFFEKRVRPVLAVRCQPCHNSKSKTGGLDLQTPEGFVQGGPSGPLVSKDRPADSRILQVTSYNERLKMPPGGKLKDDELSDLNAWVKMGAPWPGAPAAAPSNGVRNAVRGITDEERRFWAFQPMKDPALPAVKSAWAKTPIDRFILAKLEEKNLKPAPAVSKETLLRRATYDLTGLPPTPRELRDFLADNSPGAFAKVIDRLLASPRYGERWGRHWLDVARYADSTGNDEDHRYPYAWRYRDYVIDAFNRDLPYDQFVREQIAGDLLPDAGGGEVNRRGITATGFLALGPKALAQPDKMKMIYDIYDEQVDVTSRAFLGLTVACARCHDHKFDPILTKDYYSLVSIFHSTQDFDGPIKPGVSKLLYVPLAPKAEWESFQAYQQKINHAKAMIEDVTEGQTLAWQKEQAGQIAAYMLAAREVNLSHAKAAELAQAQKLDPERLDRWVEYLKPGGGRPYLEQWQKASGESVAGLAAEHQKSASARLAEWDQTIGKWRKRLQSAKDPLKPLPEKPHFDPEKDPFFHSVFLEENGPLAISAKDEKKIFSAESQTQIAALKKEAEELKASGPHQPDMACAVRDGEVVQQKVLLRGDPANEGDPVAKTFPTILLKGGEPEVTQGSGRREFAEWLSSPANPLTARVMVNRIWMGHFAEGIVRTPDNFGRMGERPSHPELLDYLALRFIESGWSMKSMHRLIMLSSAYQMSSEISAENFSGDPENRLLSRYNRRRLDVEEIRDAMLSIDGSLDLTMGGTLQEGFGTDSENSNGRLSLNPETVKRRTVYLPLRRSNLPTLLNLFDFGDAVTPSGKRVLTNVAPQALFSMNSKFVNERATQLATSGEGRDPKQRVEDLYVRILNRAPSASELDSSLTYIDRFAAMVGGTAAQSTAWQSLSRILLGTSEFLYVD